MFDSFCLWLLLSGEFTIVNRHLLHDLTNMGLWSQRMKKVLTSENGSIGNIPEIPDDLKAIYRYNNA